MREKNEEKKTMTLQTTYIAITRAFTCQFDRSISGYWRHEKRGVNVSVGET